MKERFGTNGLCSFFQGCERFCVLLVYYFFIFSVLAKQLWFSCPDQLLLLLLRSALWGNPWPSNPLWVGSSSGTPNQTSLDIIDFMGKLKNMSRHPEKFNEQKHWNVNEEPPWSSIPFL